MDADCPSGVTRPKVLAITSFFPWPLDRGDPIRVGMFLRGLNAAADLTVLAVARETTTEADERELARRLPGAKLSTHPLPPRGPGRAGAARRWLRALRRQVPSWVLLRASPQLREELCRLTAGGEYSAAFLLGEAAGIYSGDIAGTQVHWDKSNVISASTQLDIDEAPALVHKLRAVIVAWLSRRFERTVLSAVHSVSVTSPEEVQRLLDWTGAHADVVIPSAIELRRSTERGAYNPHASSVLWLGSFQYRSNTSGLQRFIDQGLPILSAAGLTLRVVGSGATRDQVQWLRGTDGIEYLGFVEDLSSAARGCIAGIVPLWSGAGVKLKTLTLLDLGLPIVSTSQGMEGIPYAAALHVSEDSLELARFLVDSSAQERVDARARGLAELDGRFSAAAFERSVLACLHGLYPSSQDGRD